MPRYLFHSARKFEAGLVPILSDQKIRLPALVNARYIIKPEALQMYMDHLCGGMAADREYIELAAPDANALQMM